MNKNTEKKFENGLYVVSTPIGNLGDITHRALDLLKAADLIACEDKRVSGKLLNHYDIKCPMISYHDHNAREVIPKLIAELEAGKTIALISDAGTPMISDPGYRLVNECHDNGIMLTSLPGASAILCALTNAGLPTNNFFFGGFLPPKSLARKKEIKKYAGLDATLVYYESPKRLLSSLKDIHEVLGDRKVAVCRELTKLYEETRRGRLSELISTYETSPTPKGEIVIAVTPPEKNAETETDLDRALIDALETLSVREAVAAVTYMTGKKRKDVYKRALELSSDD